MGGWGTPPLPFAPCVRGRKLAPSPLVKDSLLIHNFWFRIKEAINKIKTLKFKSNKRAVPTIILKGTGPEHNAFI